MSDFTILEFVTHLGVMAAAERHAEEEALVEALAIIEEEAKHSVGTYQPQSGPFAAWAPLAQSTRDDRVHNGYPADEPELREGDLRDSYESTVIRPGREGEVGSNSPIAVYQELGTQHMPPRSIVGGAAARKADEVVAVIGGRVHAALVGSSVASSLVRRIT